MSGNSSFEEPEDFPFTIREFKFELQQSEFLVGISPEGWQIVAGGCSEAKTTGTNPQKNCTPKGCENLKEKTEKIAP